MPEPIERFCGERFLVVRGAVAQDVVCACIDVLENPLRKRGGDPGDRRT
jgi:hypothetical protein